MCLKENDPQREWHYSEVCLFEVGVALLEVVTVEVGFEVFSAQAVPIVIVPFLLPAD